MAIPNTSKTSRKISAKTAAPEAECVTIASGLVALKVLWVAIPAVYLQLTNYGDRFKHSYFLDSTFILQWRYSEYNQRSDRVLHTAP